MGVSGSDQSVASGSHTPTREARRPGAGAAPRPRPRAHALGATLAALSIATLAALAPFAWALAALPVCHDTRPAVDR